MNRFKGKRIFNYNIEEVINYNLSLQSIQKALKEKFNFTGESIDCFISKGLEKYKAWSEDKQKDFIATIGGRANFKKTKALIDNFIK
jgi:hypothetical protein